MNLLRAEIARTNLDGRRRGRLPVAECFDEPQMENGIIQEFVGNGVPTLVDGFEVNLGSKGNVRWDREVESGSDA